MARAVLVTGPAGQGKSRPRHEFVAQAREGREVKILSARGNPVGAGSSFALVRQLVRQAIGLRERTAAAEQDATLRAHVASVCKNGDVARIADFLAELVTVPLTVAPSPQLRAARNDPQIMAVWLARSFGEWLGAECKSRPHLIVLDDLHWGDLPSVTYLGDGLRALATSPLMVLALARPEVHETFPGLWNGLELHEIPLGRLTPRAAERLLLAALGDGVDPRVVTRLIDRADGNPFYLEELIRRVAEGGGDELPETVLALVQSRLERLEPAARRVLRAASVFGEVFWSAGLGSLLGAAADRGELDGWLRSLVDCEVVSVAPESRFAGSREYAFRHGLLREAGYAMLTDADCSAGHRLAGEWLERAGEHDALTLAAHFERGGEPARATPWLARASEMAREGGNLDAAITLGNRGLACAVDDAQRSVLLGAIGLAHAFRGEWRAAADLGLRRLPLVPGRQQGIGLRLWRPCSPPRPSSVT